MARVVYMSIAILFMAFVTSSGKVMQPIVDAGLFVISGVMTCGDGRGYCLLGLDCTLDEEFLPDPEGHCKGLQNAFTPSAYFSCCKYKNLTGVDNFVYTMVDPVVSTLVNSYTDSTTEKMSLDNEKLKDSTKQEPVVKSDSDIMEEFNKHMENVKLKNDDRDKDVITSTTTTTTTTHEDDENTVVIDNTESDSEEESSEEEEEDDDDEGEEEQDSESDEKSENDDVKTIQLGDHSDDRDQKESNEAEEYYDSNEGDEKQDTNKEVSKDKDHMKKVDLGHKKPDTPESPGITADTVVDNVKQFLSNNKDKLNNNNKKDKVKHKTEKDKVNPKPTKTTTRPPVQVNMITTDDKDQDKVPDLEAVKQQYPPYQPQVMSEKLCMRKSNAPKCRTVWKLIHEQRTLCAGTMLDQEWMLTSASCLERIVQVGLKSVNVESHSDWKITRVMAYEGFRSEYNHTHHDIGLIRLSVPVQKNICVPCIPRLNQKFVGSECSAPFSSTSLRSGSSLLCQGVSEDYHSHGDQFMSLACRNPSGMNQNISDWNAGNGLICRGYLAGLQTPIRTEQLVYLQINPYVKWIQDNMLTTGISQKFQVGS